MDMASVEAIINSCQKGQICSCPRAKIAQINKSACGPEPKWVSDNGLEIDGHHNAEKFAKYNKCLDDLFTANTKIDTYNSIFDRCQNPHAEDGKTKFTNLPSQPVYSGDGKTLYEQVQDVKAAEQAEEARAYAAAHPQMTLQSPAPTQQSSSQRETTSNGKHVIECMSGRGGNDRHLVCLTEEPASNGFLDMGMDGRGNTIVTFRGLIADTTDNQALYNRGGGGGGPASRHFYP
jgi:hypothetical protein